MHPSPESSRLRRDLDVSALAAFENATGEMPQSRHMGGHVHRGLALGTTALVGFSDRGTRSRYGLDFGHVSPPSVGGSTTLSVIGWDAGYRSDDLQPNIGFGSGPRHMSVKAN
jgi:hypothetical protein